MATTRKKSKREKKEKATPPPPVVVQIEGLTEIEMKLLRLALDRAAYEGEADNAAIMFVRKLRERNAKADDLFGHGQASANTNGKGNETMTFGKYKNQMIKNIPIAYLVWVMNTCTNIDPQLKLAIHEFLTEN